MELYSLVEYDGLLEYDGLVEYVRVGGVVMGFGVAMSWWSIGVAEPGGPGGPWPPQKFEWVGQSMFWPPPPPKILTTGPPPPKWAASSQTLCQIASENPEMCKIFKIFRLRRANMSRNYSTGDFMLFQSKCFYLVIFFSTKSNDFIITI